MQGRRCRPSADPLPPGRSPSSRGAARCLCGPYRNKGGSAALGLGRGWHCSAMAEGHRGRFGRGTLRGEGVTPHLCPVPSVCAGEPGPIGVLAVGSCPQRAVGPPLMAGAGPVPTQCSNVPLFSWGHKGLQCGRAGPGRGRGAAGGGTAPESMMAEWVGGHPPVWGHPQCPARGGTASTTWDVLHGAGVALLLSALLMGGAKSCSPPSPLGC